MEAFVTKNTLANARGLIHPISASILRLPIGGLTVRRRDGINVSPT